VTEQDPVQRDNETTAKAAQRSAGQVTLDDLQRQLDRLRTELSIVAAERDRLSDTLTRLEAMQTDTMTLDDVALLGLADPQANPAQSIDELISTFSGHEPDIPRSHNVRVLEADASANSGEFQEMISPEAIVFGSRRDKARRRTDRFLLQIAGDSRSSCLLNEALMTIGRSDSADIQVDGDFVSRIHARILRIGMDSIIEDAGSKNGTRVNAEPISRHVLKHGDHVQIGSVGFRYVDSALGADDLD
jgi:hypothetical protein